MSSPQLGRSGCHGVYRGSMSRSVSRNAVSAGSKSLGDRSATPAGYHKKNNWLRTLVVKCTRDAVLPLASIWDFRTTKSLISYKKIPPSKDWTKLFVHDHSLAEQSAELEDLFELSRTRRYQESMGSSMHTIVVAAYYAEHTGCQ